MVSDDIRTYIDTKIAALESRVRGIEQSSAKAEVHHKNVERQLSRIESNSTWITRLVIGAIVLGILGLFVGTGMPSG